MSRKRATTRRSQTAGPLSAKDRRNFAKYVDDKHALRSARARGAGPAMKALMALSIEDEQNLCSSLDGYSKLAAMRRAAYREHVRQMKISPAIAEIVGDLAKQFGPKVKVWHNVVDWTVAILIGRYGEAPEHWPKEFTDDDVARVRSLLTKQQPMFEGVTPLGHVNDEETIRSALPKGAMLLGIDEAEGE